MNQGRGTGAGVYKTWTGAWVKKTPGNPGHQGWDPGWTLTAMDQDLKIIIPYEYLYTSLSFFFSLNLTASCDGAQPFSALHEDAGRRLYRVALAYLASLLVWGAYAFPWHGPEEASFGPGHYNGSHHYGTLVSIIDLVNNVQLWLLIKLLCDWRCKTCSNFQAI